jgi:hypothetical protein
MGGLTCCSFFGLEFTFFLFIYCQLLFLRSYGCAKLVNTRLFPRGGLFAQGSRIKREPRKFAFSRDLVEFQEQNDYDSGKCDFFTFVVKYPFRSRVVSLYIYFTILALIQTIINNLKDLFSSIIYNFNPNQHSMKDIAIRYNIPVIIREFLT